MCLLVVLLQQEWSPEVVTFVVVIVGLLSQWYSGVALLDVRLLLVFERCFVPTGVLLWRCEERVTVKQCVTLVVVVQEWLAMHVVLLVVRSTVVALGLTRIYVLQ